MNDILLFTLLSEEKMEYDEEEEGEVLVFRSQVRRGGSKFDSIPPIPQIRNRSNSTKKRMKTASKALLYLMKKVVLKADDKVFK